MSRSDRHKVVEIRITSFSARGNGIGIFETANATSISVEVPFTMIGDFVRVKLLRKFNNTYKAKLEEIITPSPDRIPARCAHFSVCGGCRMQHMSYTQQLDYKESLVRNRFANVISKETHCYPIIPSASPWQYRNKIDYSFSNDAAGEKYLGLMMDSNQGRVFNITECHLTNTWFVNVAKAVRTWWQETNIKAYQRGSETGSLRILTMREGQRTGDRMVILTVSGNPEHDISKQHLDSFVSYVRKAVNVDPTSYLSIFLRIQQMDDGMATSFYEMCLHGPDHLRERLHLQLDKHSSPTQLKFCISPSSFFHHNIYQAEELYSIAYKLVKSNPNSIVYNLYAGIGSLGFCFAKHVKQVVNVEMLPDSSEDARKNAKLNSINNTTIITAAVRHIMNVISEQLPNPDIILLSPPRSGIDPQALDNIKRLGAPQILYISSNPSLQSEDVAELVKEGYHVHSIQPMDAFPQTAHMFNIVFLTRQ